MKFLIINAYSWANKGDFGIRLGMIKSLKAVFGVHTQIKILSSTPEIDNPHYENYGANVIDWSILKSFNSPSIFKFIRAGLMVLSILFWAVLYRISKYSKKNSLINAYSEADVIISPGGGFLNDNFLLPMLLPNLFQIYLAILIGKPYIIYAQSIGPFHSRWWAFVTKSLLNRASLITVREDISKQWLSKIGVVKPPIYITSDAAFSLDPVPKNEIDKIFFQENIPPKSIVGITPVNWSFPKSKNSKLKYLEYVKALAETIDYLTMSKNLNVLLITQVTDVKNLGEDGDKITLSDVLKRIENKKNIFTLKGDYSPEELIGIYKQMDFFIGSRMHSNIFALIGEVPCIAIAYEHKTEGIMKEWGLEKWVVSIEHINSTILKVKVDEILAEEKSIRPYIKCTLQKIKENSLLNASLINKTLICC